MNRFNKYNLSDAHLIILNYFKLIELDPPSHHLPLVPGALLSQLAIVAFQHLTHLTFYLLVLLGDVNDDHQTMKRPMGAKLVKQLKSGCKRVGLLRFVLGWLL